MNVMLIPLVLVMRNSADLLVWANGPIVGGLHVKCIVKAVALNAGRGPVGPSPNVVGSCGNVDIRRCCGSHGRITCG